MNERALHVTIGSFACLMLMAIVLSVRLSTVQPPFGTQLYGSSHVWRGHTASFRVQLIDSDGYSVAATRRTTFTLRDEHGARAPREVGAGDLTTVALQIPADLGAYACLDVEVDGPVGSDRLSVAIRSYDAPSLTGGRIVSWRENLDPHLPFKPGAWSVAAYPGAGRLVGGLENQLTLRVTHDNAPVAAAVMCEPGGMGGRSDAAGLLPLMYRPAPKGGALSCTVDQDPNRRVELHLEAPPTQLTLALPNAALVQPSAAIAVGIATLPFRSPVFVDLWAGDALVASTAGIPERGLLKLALTVPADAHGLLRFTAYRSLARPEDTATHAIRWAAHAGAATQLTEARATLAALPGGDPALEAMLQAPAGLEDAVLGLALSRFVPETAGPLLLSSTGEARRAAFEAAKEAQRTTIHHFFAGVMGIGLGMAVLWMARHQRRTRAAVRAVMRDGQAAGEAIDPKLTDKMSNLEQIYMLLLSLIALGMAGYGLFTLLAKLRWDR